MHDINGELSQASLLPPASYNANTNGAGVNVSGFEGVLKVILQAATLTGTSPTFDIKAQTSTDNSNWTDVPGAAFGEINTGNVAAIQAIPIDTRDLGGYLRLVETAGGTTPAAILSATLVGLPKYR